MKKRFGRCVVVVSWLLPMSAVLAVACQKLDPNLTGGTRLPAVTGIGGMTGSVNQGMGGADVVAVDCPSVRMQAHDILQTNCAICHQAPGMPSLYTGSFNFILDLAKLTSMASPSTQKYVVKGVPGESYIYQRITNSTMPPSTRTQRPSAADKQIMNQWITTCIDDPTSPEGWTGTSAPTDAGPPPDAGPPLQACSVVKACPDGACCVYGRCRPNGTTCGQIPSPIVGQAMLPGLPGMCDNGSCQTDMGDACGKVGQACCAVQSCTVALSSCLTTDMTKCSACGTIGLPCCNPNNCVEGNACIGFGVGRVGTCEECGGLGQPCCGSGPPASPTRMCNGGLMCVRGDASADTVCVTSDSDGGSDR